MIRSTLVVAAITLTGVCLPLFAADVSNVPARRALAVPLSELSVENQPLSKVMNFLRDTSGTNLVVNWRALEAANVTKDTPISLQVANLSLRKMLRLVLDQAGASANLVYNIDENVIEITTQEEADKKMITRVYVVDDIVMPSNKSQIMPVNLGLGSSTTVSGSGGGGGGAGGGAAGGIFGTPNQTPASADATADADKAGQDLVKLIMDTVRPSIWKDNGGNASIKYFQGKLVVTAPLSVQEAIGGPVPDASRRFGF